jgi:hypothetical protein
LPTPAVQWSHEDERRDSAGNSYAMEPMEENKTARQQPEPQRAVFSFRERFWRESAGLSVLLFAAAVAVAGISWTYLSGDGTWAGFSSRRSASRATKVAAGDETPAPPPAPPTARRVIDGMPVAEGAAEGGYYAVMIDNHSDARPQAGVAEASLVYEAPVEGGITRLLAVYPSDAKVERIGPIRSARPYYLDWASELDATYVHVGGSPEALDRIKATSGFMDLNEMYAGKYFWRDKARLAPHSTFTSMELLRQAREARFADRDRKDIAGWKFKDDAPVGERPESGAELVIGYADTYRVTWRYDRDANQFVRMRGGKEEKDATGVSVRAKNVVVQYVETKVLDEVGRRRIDTKGGGEALAAIDGRTVGGRWKAVGGRTVFVDAAGNEFAFDAGTTWIEVVPNDTPVTH